MVLQLKICNNTLKNVSQNAPWLFCFSYNTFAINIFKMDGFIISELDKTIS